MLLLLLILKYQMTHEKSVGDNTQKERISLDVIYNRVSMKKKRVLCWIAFLVTPLLCVTSANAQVSLTMEKTVVAGTEEITNDNANDNTDRIEDVGNEETEKDETIQPPEELPEVQPELNIIGMSIAKSYLNIRSEASIEGNIIARMSQGAIGTVKSISGEWAYITSGKFTGYVNVNYLVLGEEAKAQYSKYVDRKATVRASKLKVRSKASTKGKILTTIKKGAKYKVIDSTSKWVKLTANKKTGWVAKEYVSIEYDFEYATSIPEGSSNSQSKGKEIVAYAKKFVGNPYVYGGTSLTRGADCSGFTQSVYKKFNIKLPRTSRQQAKVGKKVATSQRQEGDLLFYRTNGTVDHVAIYIGNNKVVHASNKKDGIRISKYNYRKVYSIRRMI